MNCPELTPEYLKSQGLSENFPERFWAKVNKNGPIPKHWPELGQCWEWTSPTLCDGYGQIRPNRTDNCIRTTRAAFLLQHGPIPDGLWVLHRCDNPRCVRDTHIYADTPKENVQDCIRKGRRATHHWTPNFGEKHALSKLTWEKVASARARHASGESSIRELSEEYGVAFQTIWSVIKNRTWIRSPTELPRSYTLNPQG